MRKRIVGLALALALVLTALAGFGVVVTARADAAPADKIQLEFWAHWGSVTRRPIIEKMVSDFNAQSNTIQVKYVYYPYGDIWTKNAANIAAGTPCDAIINDVNTVRYRGSEGQTEPLDKYLAADPTIADRFRANMWAVMGDGSHIYGLPFNTDTRVLVYNKAQFTEVGLDPDKPPVTWDDLWAYADKLDIKNADGTYARIGFSPTANYCDLGYDFWLMSADKGVSWFDYANGENICVDTPAKLDALNWIAKWRDRYGQSELDRFAAQFGAREQHGFLTQKVSMWVVNITFLTQLRDYGGGVDWAVAPVPEYKPGNGHYSWSGGFDIEIPKGAKNPDASWEFLKYITDVDAQSYWASWNFDVMGNKNAKPEDFIAQKLTDAYTIAMGGMDLSCFTPQPMHAPDYPNIINPLFDQFYQGQIDAATMLKQGQKALEDLVANN